MDDDAENRRADGRGQQIPGDEYDPLMPSHRPAPEQRFLNKTSKAGIFLSSDFQEPERIERDQNRCPGIRENGGPEPGDADDSGHKEHCL